MSIQIKFFGPLTDVVGCSQLAMTGIADVESLRNKILADFPSMKNHSYMVAVDKKIVSGNVVLKSGDEVALLPPFAGG